MKFLNEREMQNATRNAKKSINFHLINYLYIIHLSCIFCVFTQECKYILRDGHTKKNMLQQIRHLYVFLWI